MYILQKTVIMFCFALFVQYHSAIWRPSERCEEALRAEIRAREDPRPPSYHTSYTTKYCSTWKTFAFRVFEVVFLYGKGIFSNPLHIKIQYSAVISPPPALISHCDQEKYTLTYYIEFYNNICIGNTMIFRVRKKPRNYLPRSNPLF